MTTRLEIDRFDAGGVDLAELLSMVGAELVGSLRWRITDLTLDGAPSDVDYAEALLSAVPVSGRRLTIAAQSPITVVSGRFAGYRGDDPEPFVELAAVGFAWELSGQDDEVLLRIGRQTGVL